MSVTANRPSIIPIDLLAEVLQLKLNGLSTEMIAEHCYARGQRDAIRDEMAFYEGSAAANFDVPPGEMN